MVHQLTEGASSTRRDEFNFHDSSSMRDRDNVSRLVDFLVVSFSKFGMYRCNLWFVAVLNQKYKLFTYLKMYLTNNMLTYILDMNEAQEHLVIL